MKCYLANFDGEYVTPEILNIKKVKSPYSDCKCHKKQKVVIDKT